MSKGFFTFLQSMIITLSISCFFYAHTSFAAGTIPRDSLRLELLLATGAVDTSGNNRPVTATGLAPIYLNDPTYGIPYGKFGSGGLRVNTTWTPGMLDEFSISLWVKINQNDIRVNSGAGLSTNLSVFSGSQPPYSTTNYQKPQVIFSTKTNQHDGNGIRLALTNDGQCSIGNNISVTQYWVNDMYSILNPQFNCQSILDNKWHHIIISRKGGVLNPYNQNQYNNLPNVNVYLDGLLVWAGSSWNTQFTISKYITFGSLGIASHTGITNYYPSTVQQDILNSHYFRGGIAGFRIYSRDLTPDEREALGDEYRQGQANLSGTGNIQLAIDQFTRPNLSLFVRNVPTNLSMNNVVYQYSLNSGAFLPMLNIVDISTSTGSYDYRMSMDLSSVPDGTVNIALRVGSGQTYQSIGTVSFNKNYINLNITINQPNTDLAPVKNITASVDNGGILYFLITRGSTCGEGLGTWEDYSELSFPLKSDNGIRVCYKALIPGTTRAFYKLSVPIQGINPPEANPIPSNNLFNNYLLWRKSAYQNPNDTASMVLELFGVSASASQGTINGVSVIDVNGDGLVDFVYSRSDTIRRAIIVNNGNFTFRIAYKCAIDGTSPNFTYYGDCADPTR